MDEDDCTARWAVWRRESCCLLLLGCFSNGLLLLRYAMKTLLILKLFPSPQTSVPTHCVSVTYINFCYSTDPFWLL